MQKCRNVELRTVSTQTELIQWQDDFNWSSQDMVKKKVPPMVKKYGGAGRVGERSSWGPAGLVGRRGARSGVWYGESGGWCNWAGRAGVSGVWVG
jgi:hypothetical protein